MPAQAGIFLYSLPSMALTPEGHRRFALLTKRQDSRFAQL
jgi:hypothetical protein